MTKYNHADDTYQKEVVATFEVGNLDKEKHFENLNKWWNLYYNGEIPESFVPKHGSVIYFRGKLVASCFLYINDTKLCHLDFCMVDPEMGAGRRVFFLRHVIEAGIKKAKEIVGDDVTIWSLTDHAVVGRVYQEKGFHLLGEGDCFAYTSNEKNKQFLL